jgi:hypothetical protein
MTFDGKKTIAWLYPREIARLVMASGLPGNSEEEEDVNAAVASYASPRGLAGYELEWALRCDHARRLVLRCERSEDRY